MNIVEYKFKLSFMFIRFLLNKPIFRYSGHVKLEIVFQAFISGKKG